VYRSLVAGGAVSNAAPVGSIASASGGGRAGGWGSGGWGSGGWGRAARRYRFVDLDRPSGLWAYGVVPVNDLGESGSASEAAVRVEASPRGPGVIPGDPHGRRARIQVDSGAPMLRWGHSPDYVGPPPAGQDEIQRITTSGGGGFGTLTVGWYGGGNGTTTLNSGDSAATIAAKLGTIAGLAGNVTVAGGPLNAAPVDVRFTGALASTAIDESTDGLTIVLATAFASASIDVVQQGSAP
jgi:hypothetical protein